MTANDRIEWIAAAADTLRDVPADLLHIACRKARSACDHPSKIIPFVMNDIRAEHQWRSTQHRELREAANPPPQPKWVNPEERKKVAAMMTEWKAYNYSAAYARQRGWGE